MADQDAPAAIMATTGKATTMADNTLRLVVEIPPTHAKLAFSLFGMQGTPVALALLTPEASVGELRKETIAGAKGPHGDAYTLLYKTGFWFAPALHDALGIAGEVQHVRDADGEPKDIIDLVKGVIYREFGVESMTDVPPENFRIYLDGLGIAHLLPREFA